MTAANLCQSHRLPPLQRADRSDLQERLAKLASYRNCSDHPPHLHRGREKKNVLPDTKLCLHNENEANFEPLESGRQAELPRRAKANPGASSLARNSLKTWRGITNSWSNR